MKKLYLPLALLCASYASLYTKQESLHVLMHEIAHLTTEKNLHPLMQTFFTLEKKNEVFGIEKEALKKLCSYALEILENNHSKIAQDSYLQNLIEELAFFEQKSQKSDIYLVQKALPPYSYTPSRISVITVDGDLYCKDAMILGNAHINQQLIVDNTITANNSLSVAGNIDATGNVLAHAHLTVDGDTTMAGHLTVAQPAQFNDFVSAQHGIAFSPQHQLSANGNIIAADLACNNAHINQQLIVDNIITANNNLSVAGNIDATGNVLAHAHLTVDGDTTMAGHLTVAQPAQFNDFVSAQHGIAFSPQHQLSANGNIIAADLACNNAHINQQLIVDNIITANNNLSVAGNIDAAGNVQAHAHLAVDGDTTMAGHLTVAQSAQFNSPVVLQQGIILPHGALQQLDSLTTCSQQPLSDGTYVRIHAFNLHNTIQHLSSGIFTFNVKSLIPQANALGCAFGMFLAQDPQTISTSLVATKTSDQTQHIRTFVANSSFNQLSQEQQLEALNLLNGIIPGATLNSVLLFVLVHDEQPQEQLDCGRINLIQVS